MTQLSDDCFAFGGELTRIDDALRMLRQRTVRVVASEKTGLSASHGRVLAEDVVAGRNVPPHDNSAVDGYVAYFDDLAPGGETRLPISGQAAAGRPLDRPLERGQAARILTGAPMPDGPDGGPDVVLMQEDCREEDGSIVIPAGIGRGANRRKAGEDIRAGDAILRAGRRLRPQDIGLAASVGCTELSVFKPLRVAILSTGDEIGEPGSALRPGQVYDANRFTVAALLEGLGCQATDLGILPDDPKTIASALANAAGSHDLIVTSGGVSAGSEDHVRAAVEKNGALHFWRLAVKPGRPVALGQIGRTPFIGLPGNPVAAVVVFLKLGRPLIQILSGCDDSDPEGFVVRADFSYRKKPGRREWVRAGLARAEDGALIARKFVRDGAGILSSLVGSDGLVELPEDQTDVAPGNPVSFFPFGGFGL